MSVRGMVRVDIGIAISAGALQAALRTPEVDVLKYRNFQRRPSNLEPAPFVWTDFRFD